MREVLGVESSARDVNVDPAGVSQEEEEEGAFTESSGSELEGGT